MASIDKVTERLQRIERERDALRSELDALKLAQAQFLASLNERIAEIEALRKSTGKEEQVIINGRIGLIQAIIHDYERIKDGQ